MNLQEFDKAIDNHRRKWKRCKFIAKFGNLKDGECIYMLYDYAGRKVMQARWTPAIAESLREEFEWERAKLRA